MSPEANAEHRVFRPRARLMATLGHELISSDVVALAELVKNAYDADARHVVIEIAGSMVEDGALDPDSGSIRILDDGSGMTYDTVVNAWLEPATDYRTRELNTPSGRRVLGEKGVGRFATAKLGRRLELATRASSSEELYLDIDWSIFEADLYLDELAVDLERRDPICFDIGGASDQLWYRSVFSRNRSSLGPTQNQGTMLTITGLRSRWTSELVRNAQLALERLISPLDDERDIQREFRIALLCPQDFGIAGEVERPEILQRPHYRLYAEVDERGAATVLMELKDGSELQRDDVQLTTADETPQCGPLILSLNVWDRDRDSLLQITDNLKGARADLDRACGVSVYRDGFRVLPYGEPDDDWLRLDMRRVQVPTRRLSNNQLIGYVLIGRDSNPGLRDQSNREGLMEGQPLSDLRSLILSLLTLVEAERFKLRPRRVPRKRPSLFDPVELTGLAEIVRTRYPRDAQLQEEVSRVSEQIKERFSQVGETLARYHRLATLGELIDMVVHDSAQPIATIRNSAAAGKDKVERSPFDTIRPRLHVNRLTELFDRIELQGFRMREMIRRIEPLGGRRRGRPQKFQASEAIDNAVGLLHQSIQLAGIRVEVDASDHDIALDGTELQRVLINLLQNSIYWLKHVPRANRQIHISTTVSTDEHLILVIEDSGPGVSPDDRDYIFDPYFSTKPDGVGLGLTIVGEIVKDYYDGELELLDEGQLGGARFRATFRRRVQ